MTMAVASKVSEAKNENLLGPSPGMETLSTIAFNNHLTSINIVVAFALQPGVCIRLLGVTLKDITFDSPCDTDPTAGCNEDKAVAVVAAEEPHNWDAWLTAGGSPQPNGSDWTAGLGSCVGELLMTRPPGYSLPPLPSFVLGSLANMDEAVWRYSQQTNDNWEWTEHFGRFKTYEAIESQGTRYYPRYKRWRFCKGNYWDYDNCTYQQLICTSLWCINDQ